MDRVDPKTFFCPQGTDPCSLDTQPVNTICYKGDKDTKCPITDLSFVYANDPADFSAIAQYNFDSLPITSTRVEHKPCILPDEVSMTPNAVFYPVELDRLDGCSIDPVSGTEHDERYRPSNYEISEYEMQTNSGVFDALNKAPNSAKYLGDSPIA